MDVNFCQNIPAIKILLFGTVYCRGEGIFFYIFSLSMKIFEYANFSTVHLPCNLVLHILKSRKTSKILYIMNMQGKLIKFVNSFVHTVTLNTTV